MDVDDYFLFDHAGFHKTKLTAYDLDAEENAEVKASLIFSLDGSIIGVKSDIIKSYLKLPDVKKYRSGNLITPNKFPVTNADELYTMIAIFLPLDVD